MWKRGFLRHHRVRGAGPVRLRRADPRGRRAVHHRGRRGPAAGRDTPAGGGRAGVTVPFRWDVRRREQLGRLLETAPLDPRAWWHGPYWAEFLDELRICAARVVARAGNARMVFVGRSPESLYDYLTGALAGTDWEDRCELLNVSLFGGDAHRFVAPPAMQALRDQFAACGLTPAEIAAAPLPVAFVDLVSSGGTFGSLSDTI